MITSQPPNHVTSAIVHAIVRTEQVKINGKSVTMPPTCCGYSCSFGVFPRKCFGSFDVALYSRSQLVRIRGTLTYFGVPLVPALRSCLASLEQKERHLAHSLKAAADSHEDSVHHSHRCMSTEIIPRCMILL